MLKTVGFPSTRTGDQTIVNGNLVIGTAGNGIDFSASSHSTGMTSELLDDYEEGAWTPVLRGSGTAGTYETQLLVGTYTRVGRMVQVECIIRLAASITGGGTGYAQITSLPFSIAANSAATGAVAFEGVDWTAGTNLVVRPITLSATTTLFFPEIADNASSSSVQISGFSASDHIYFSLMYQTT